MVRVKKIITPKHLKMTKMENVINDELKPISSDESDSETESDNESDNESNHGSNE